VHVIDHEASRDVKEFWDNPNGKAVLVLMWIKGTHCWRRLHEGFMGREFWRFVLVQEAVFKPAQTAIEFRRCRRRRASISTR
jgi:hypothetical protein